MRQNKFFLGRLFPPSRGVSHPAICTPLRPTISNRKLKTRAWHSFSSKYSLYHLHMRIMNIVHNIFLSLNFIFIDWKINYQRNILNQLNVVLTIFKLVFPTRNVKRTIMCSNSLIKVAWTDLPSFVCINLAFTICKSNIKWVIVVSRLLKSSLLPTW